VTWGLLLVISSDCSSIAQAPSWTDLAQLTGSASLPCETYHGTVS
jgi:hypothetical protein